MVEKTKVYIDPYKIKYGSSSVPKTKSRKVKPLLTQDVIDQDEVKYNQHQNRIANEKIEDIYFSAMESMRKAQGEILEKISREHKRQINYSEFDDEDNYKWNSIQ